MMRESERECVLKWDKIIIPAVGTMYFITSAIPVSTNWGLKAEFLFPKVREILKYNYYELLLYYSVRFKFLLRIEIYSKYSIFYHYFSIWRIKLVLSSVFIYQSSAVRKHLRIQLLTYIILFNVKFYDVHEFQMHSKSIILNNIFKT